MKEQDVIEAYSAIKLPMNMGPELRYIATHDWSAWNTFASSPTIDEPWDAFGWFMLKVGYDGKPGEEDFAVLVTTPAAIPRAKKDSFPGKTRGDNRFVTVEEFRADLILQTLRELISSTPASKLTTFMYSEYENR